MELLGPLLFNFLYFKCSVFLLFRSLAFFQQTLNTAFALFSVFFFFFFVDADTLPNPFVCLGGAGSAFSLSLHFLLVKSLCGLEASQVPAVEALSGAGEPCDIIDSSDEMDAQEESIRERAISRKKKSKRHRGTGLVLSLD